MATGSQGNERNLNVRPSSPHGVGAWGEHPSGTASGLPGAADDGHRQGSLIHPCLLLLLHNAPAHGYELAKRLNRLGFETELRTVYRNLEALQRLELVCCEWDAQHGSPAHRTYNLTAPGIEELERSAQQLRLHVSDVCHLLARSDSASPAPPLRRGMRWLAGRRSPSNRTTKSTSLDRWWTESM